LTYLAYYSGYIQRWFTCPQTVSRPSSIRAWCQLTILCSEKNTHSRCLLYLRGKCLDLHKIFRLCLKVIRHSIEVKIKYSLLLLLTRKHFIKCLSSVVVWQTCKHDVSQHTNDYTRRPPKML